VSKAHVYTFELVAAFCCLFLACRPSTRYAIKKAVSKERKKKVRYGNENRRLAFPGRPLSAQVSSRIWSDDGCLNLSSSRLPITQFHPSSSRLYRPDSSSSHPISTSLLFFTVLQWMGCPPNPPTHPTLGACYVNVDNYVCNDCGTAGDISTLTAGNKGVVVIKILLPKTATAPLHSRAVMLKRKKPGASCMTLPILFLMNNWGFRRRGREG
jgi:hypothetical protein